MEGVYRDWVKTYGNEKGQLTFYKAVGCEKCNNSGYKGRCGLHELLIATDPLKKLIAEKARVAEMLAVALEEGMRTLKQDGMEKCLAGITSLKEVRSVCIK
jgi:type II secretory ATPase GspE/PulE/Tfp pilus assembly ATPase PilB-like protein